MVGRGFTNCVDKNDKYIYVGDLIKYKNELYVITTRGNSFYMTCIKDDTELVLWQHEKETEVVRSSISLD